MMSATEIRLDMLRLGYSPLPAKGKAVFLKGWQDKIETNPEEIAIWDKIKPDHDSTAVNATLTPPFDIDIRNPEAAEAVENLVREMLEDREGEFIVRIGNAPKRAILFQTSQPFAKIQIPLIAPDGSTGQKLEFLGKGQQLIVYGIHPDTGKPYSWHADRGPIKVHREALPHITEDEARQLIEAAADLLCRDFGYRRPEKASPGPGPIPNGHDWAELLSNILTGQSFHDSLVPLAMKLLRAGTEDSVAVNLLYAVMDQIPVEQRDQRWHRARREIAPAVSSARGKIGTTGAISGSTAGLDPPAPVDPYAGWPKLDTAKAHIGIVGEIVRAIDPTTEADPVAILLQLLTCFGSSVGRKPYFRVESDRHFPNLFCLLVGASSKGRKGTSRQRVMELMAVADPEWERSRVEGGLSSGEGLIYAVRDERRGLDKEGNEITLDAGTTDKRLLVYEGEFASTLAVMGREGNTLSQIIRNSWDGLRLSVMTRKDPLRASDAMISIVGHITAEELRRELDRVSMANGFANRFLMACIKRSKLLPHGGGLDLKVVNGLGLDLKRRTERARGCGQVERTQDCQALWASMYDELAPDVPGLLGSIIARAEAQMLRLSLLYALLCDEPKTGECFADPVVIRAEHLEAARAVWDYCDASARFIFGDMVGDPVMDEILRALRAAGQAGMSRTQISDLFSRNKASSQIGAALEGLRVKGKAHSKMAPGTTRPVEYWYAGPPPRA